MSAHWRLLSSRGHGQNKQTKINKFQELFTKAKRSFPWSDVCAGHCGPNFNGQDKDAAARRKRTQCPGLSVVIKGCTRHPMYRNESSRKSDSNLMKVKLDSQVPFGKNQGLIIPEGLCSTIKTNTCLLFLNKYLCIFLHLTRLSSRKGHFLVKCQLL